MMLKTAIKSEKWIRLLALTTVLIATSNLVGGRNVYSAYSESEIRSVESAQESKIRELREEEMTQLKFTLKRRSFQNRQADLYFRLAELYLEAYRAEFRLEARVHELRLEQERPDPLMDRSNSKAFLEAGIQACEEILSLKTPFDRMDQVYYFLGFYQGELGNRAESSRYFELLAQSAPKSRWTSLGYFELGQYAALNGRFAESLLYFEKAEKIAEPQTKASILHKKAWSYFRTRKYDQASQSLKEAVSICSQFPEKLSPLRTEILLDLASFMTEAGQANEAIRYFSEIDPTRKLYPRLLEKLGKNFERNADLQKAALVYENLANSQSDSEFSLRGQLKLAELELKQQKFSSGLDRLKKIKNLSQYVKDFQNAQTPKNAQKKEDQQLDGETQQIIQNLKILIRKTAVSQHEVYRTQNKRPELELAENFYIVYLDIFSRSVDFDQELPEIQMYLAEVKESLGKLPEAAALYSEVVISKNKKYGKQAAVLWIKTLEKQIRLSAKSKLSQETKLQETKFQDTKFQDTNPQVNNFTQQDGSKEPSLIEKEYVHAYDTIQEALGNIEETRDPALRSAQILAGYSSTRSDAIQRMNEILSNWPSSQQAWVAAQLWLQIAQVDELPSVIQALKARFELLEIDRTKNNGALKALLDQQESRIQKSETSKTTEKLKKLALQALIDGKFAESAQSFEKLGTEYHDSDSLMTSGRLYSGLGDAKQAHRVWEMHLRLYPRSSARGNVALMLGQSLEKSNGVRRRSDHPRFNSDHLRFDDAGSAYQLCWETPGTTQAECGIRLAEVSKNDAKKIYQTLVHLKPLRSNEGGNFEWFTGYAQYRLALLQEKAASFEPLQLPEKHLKKALDQRFQFFSSLSRSYQAVRGVWAVVALYQIALWASQFADEVDAIVPPSSLKRKALASFKTDIHSISQSLRENANSIWEDAYQKAQAIQLIHPIVLEIARRARSTVSSDSRSNSEKTSDSKYFLNISQKLKMAGSELQELMSNSDQKNKLYRQLRERLRQASIFPTSSLFSPSSRASQSTQSSPSSRISQSTQIPQNPQAPSSSQVSIGAQAWRDYGSLLRQEGKPGLARLVTERAIQFNPRDATLLNNLAVIKMDELKNVQTTTPNRSTQDSGAGLDWIVLFEVGDLLKEAIALDTQSTIARENLNVLMQAYQLKKGKSP